LLLLIAAVVFVLYVLVPTYASPNSRVYASHLGYPSVMRLLHRPIQVEVEPVQMRPMVRTIAAEGAITYLNEIPVLSEVPGVVTKVLVEEGERIQRGKVLLHVNPGGHTTRMFELRRQLTQAELAYAKLQMEWQQKLNDRNLTSKAVLEAAKANLHRAEAASKLAMEEYAHTLRSRSVTVTGEPPPLTSVPVATQKVEIVATTNGTVIRRKVQLGENLIDLRQPLLLIGDQLVFRANVDQRYAGLLRIGDRGQSYLRARPWVVIPAEVIRVAPYVQPAPQRASSNPGPPPFTFAVWMSISASVLAEQNLLRGMNGYAVFERAYTAPAVPESALMRYSGRTGTVLTADDSNHLQLKTVTYTGAENGWVAIESNDVREGNLVVVNGQTALKPGDKVIMRNSLQSIPTGDR